MATYWVFCLDGGRVRHHLDFNADDDGEAVELMTIRQEDCDCEVWHGDRKVATMQRGEAPILVARSQSACASPAS